MPRGRRGHRAGGHRHHHHHHHGIGHHHRGIGHHHHGIRHHHHHGIGHHHHGIGHHGIGHRHRRHHFNVGFGRRPLFRFWFGPRHVRPHPVVVVGTVDQQGNVIPGEQVQPQTQPVAYPASGYPPQPVAPSAPPPLQQGAPPGAAPVQPPMQPPPIGFNVDASQPLPVTSGPGIPVEPVSTQTPEGIQEDAPEDEPLCCNIPCCIL